MYPLSGARLNDCMKQLKNLDHSSALAEGWSFLLELRVFLLEPLFICDSIVEYNIHSAENRLYQYHQFVVESAQITTSAKRLLRKEVL